MTARHYAEISLRHDTIDNPGALSLVCEVALIQNIVQDCGSDYCHNEILFNRFGPLANCN